MEFSSHKARRAISSRERSLARAISVLLLLGSGFIALSLALPHPSGGDDRALAAIAWGMAAGSALCWALSPRIPVPVSHGILALAALANAGAILASGIAAGNYGALFVWSMLVGGYFFPRRQAIAHLAWILVLYGGILLTVADTGGYSPLTRWLFTAVSLSVVMLLTSEIVRHREQADMRARRFFDLSQDMLSTMDVEGRCVEINAAWRTWLGYTAEDMEGRPLLDITHPGDLRRAVEHAGHVFKGDDSGALETRVRAKDGSWHWLRSTATYAADEHIVYARSTDVTKLKEIEAEREQLLHRVEELASSDSLTGLPNRRSLEEQIPREMSRARRERRPLSLAIVDIDRFKDFNDAHGHLAGDELLRECAAAWDSQLRGEDTVSRFGGEEFVVLLPGTGAEEAWTVVERLRAATPRGETVSAGLACWDMEESIEELIGRADAALYVAKEEGRDRLVQAA
jgi:diguanylate cyclase (GGDEF)-like protein/PAS domain S-box-containing protein